MPKRILAIDDDENILNLEKTILEQEGYEVLTALTAPDALERLKEGAIDLILLDVMMPDMDGFTLCRKIKQEEALKNIPVVFLTAKSGGEALAEGFESGGIMYIRKPFTAAKLMAIVGTLLATGQNRL
jgi:two-component system sensor histidine kinase/response regulator